MDEKDRGMLHWLDEFNKYDLYSKGMKPVNVDEVKGYYEDLIARYFPGKVWF
jgi:inositol oxygenase